MMVFDVYKLKTSNKIIIKAQLGINDETKTKIPLV